MQYTGTDGHYILRIDKGEMVHATLHEFCNRHDIKNALIQGIGAVEFVRCGWYDLQNRSYKFQEYQELVEVASYMGNVLQKESGPFIHAHAVFSDVDNQTFAGHVDEMRVGVVFEVVLTPLHSNIKRTYDEATGLYLMDLTNDNT